MSNPKAKSNKCQFCSTEMTKCNCNVAQCNILICDKCEYEIKPYSADPDYYSKLLDERSSEKSLDDKATSLGIVSEGQKLTPAALEAWASRERSMVDQIRDELVGKMLSLDPMRDEYQRGGYDAIRQDIEIIDRINPKEAK